MSSHHKCCTYGPDRLDAQGANAALLRHFSAGPLDGSSAFLDPSDGPAELIVERELDPRVAVLSGVDLLADERERGEPFEGRGVVAEVVGDAVHIGGVAAAHRVDRRALSAGRQPSGRWRLTLLICDLQLGCVRFTGPDLAGAGASPDRRAVERVSVRCEASTKKPPGDSGQGLALDIGKVLEGEQLSLAEGHAQAGCVG